MFIFYRTLEWVRWACGIVPKSAIGSPRVYYVFYYIFLILIAILLAVFTEPILKTLGNELYLKFGRQKGLCGILFVLSYAIVRVVLKLVELLGIEEESEFPDIETDWKKILTALDRENLTLDELPLFLVNGLTPHQERAAFEQASEITWRVIAPPISQENASVRAFVSDEAVFLSCTGIGATNFQQGKIAEVPLDPGRNPGAIGGRRAYPTQRQMPVQAQVAGQVPGPAPGPPDVPRPPLASSPGRLANLGTMSPGGLRKAMQTMKALSVEKGYGKQPVNPLSPLELEVGGRRMNFLCKLIDDQRYPFVQINGMLQAFPFSWSSDENYATQLAPAIREDLITVHSAFQLQFPLVAAITEFDDLHGVKDFLLQIDRIQPGIRMSRAGHSFASGAEISDRNAMWLVDSATTWFRGWIYTAFGIALHECDRNQKLFQLLCEISQRRRAVATLLRETLYKRLSPEVQLYGAYFTATGRNVTEQGFVRGLLSKLEENQGRLAWTPELLSVQKRSRWLAAVSITAAVVMALMSVAILLFGVVLKKGDS